MDKNNETIISRQFGYSIYFNLQVTKKTKLVDK